MFRRLTLLLMGALVAAAFGAAPNSPTAPAIAAAAASESDLCARTFEKVAGFSGAEIEVFSAEGDQPVCVTTIVPDENHVVIVGAATNKTLVNGAAVHESEDSLMALLGPQVYQVNLTWGQVRRVPRNVALCEFDGWMRAAHAAGGEGAGFSNVFALPEWNGKGPQANCAAAQNAAAVSATEPMPTNLAPFAIPARNTWNPNPKLGESLFAFSTDEPAAVSHTLHVRGQLRKGEVLITMAGRIASVPGKEGVIRVVWGPVLYDDSAQNALFYGTTGCLAHAEVARLAAEAKITNIEPFPSRTELCGE